MRLLYLSPLPWTSFAQRPHRFIEWFRKRFQDEVLWVDPYPTRLPIWPDLHRLKVMTGAGSNHIDAPIPPWLQVIKPKAIPIEPLPGSFLLNRPLWGDLFKQCDQFLSGTDCILGVGKPSELALQLLSRNPEVQTFYDAMDNFPLFYKGVSRRAMARRESAVAARVKKILVSSTALAEKFSAYKDKRCLALNACEVATLPDVDVISASAKPPVLGYVGTIGKWFDWTFIVSLATANAGMRIRLIGPIHDHPPERLPENIELLPECDHATAILSMRQFSVGLIPFLRNELTASIDPIKYYEYRALGLPVLSTAFGEMNQRKSESGVFLVCQQSDLAESLLGSLSYQPDKNEIKHFRTANSWEARFDACALADLKRVKAQGNCQQA